MRAFSTDDKPDATAAGMPVPSKDSNEYSFVQNLFKSTYSVNLPLGTMKAVNDAFARSVGTQAGGIGSLLYFDHGFPLGQFVLIHITTAHGIMAFIKDEDTQARILLDRTEHLITALQIIFKAIYKTEMSAEFAEQLEQCLYLSTSLSFAEDTAKKYLHDYNLVGAYQNKAPLFGFTHTLANNYTLFSQTLAATALPAAESKIALTACKSFYDNLLTEYEKNTVPVSSFMSKGVGLVFGSIAAIGGWFFDFGFFTSAVGVGVAGFVTEQLSRSSLGQRALSDRMQDSYLRTLKLRADEVGENVNARLKGVKPELLNQAKAAFSLWCHFTAVISRRWRETELRTRSDQVFAQTPASQPTFDLPVFLNSADNQVSPTVYRAAADTYQKIKKPKKQKRVAVNTADEKSAVPNSYQAITFQLSAALQQQGILVTEGPSKAFFNYGDHEQVIKKGLGDKLQNGVFEGGFGAKTGDFGCYKFETNLIVMN